ncbi:MAG: hypothetical protein JRH20_14955 [Deltaproteobacteria bacterium]|nr:hypothetical protein [Deltaproteobacteria bacterium]
MKIHTRASLFIFIVVLSVTQLAVAKEKKASKFSESITVADKAIVKKAKIEGWSGDLRLGATFAVASNSNVVGSPDGTTLVLGAQLKGSLAYRSGPHDWRNRLSITETATQAPPLDKLLKSSDALSLESLYFYRIANSWIGPFVRFSLNTALFEGTDYRTENVIYRVKGLQRTFDIPADELHLSDPFGPLMLQEAVGFFGEPLNKKPIKIELWAAFGARQTLLADQQFALNDDDKTKDIIEVKELEDYAQAGPIAGLSVSGSLVKDVLGYFARGEAMIPVVKTDLPAGDDRSAIDLMNVLIEAGLSIKVFSWAAINYSFRALREPQLLDRFQLQNSLLLTFTYSLLESAQKK